MLVELKACFMEAYDDNQDGKIDIREVSVKRTMCCGSIWFYVAASATAPDGGKLLTPLPFRQSFRI